MATNEVHYVDRVVKIVPLAYQGASYKVGDIISLRVDELQKYANVVVDPSDTETLTKLFGKEFVKKIQAGKTQNQESVAKAKQDQAIQLIQSVGLSITTVSEMTKEALLQVEGMTETLVESLDYKKEVTNTAPVTDPTTTPEWLEKIMQDNQLSEEELKVFALGETAQADLEALTGVGEATALKLIEYFTPTE